MLVYFPFHSQQHFKCLLQKNTTMRSRMKTKQKFSSNTVKKIRFELFCRARNFTRVSTKKNKYFDYCNAYTALCNQYLAMNIAPLLKDQSDHTMKKSLCTSWLSLSVNFCAFFVHPNITYAGPKTFLSNFSTLFLEVQT